MRVLAIICCIVLISAFLVQVKGEKLKRDIEHSSRNEKRHSLRDSVTMDAIELLGGSVNGSLAENGKDTFMVNLDKHEVLDFYVMYSYYGTLSVYLQGSHDNWVLYGDTTYNTSIPNTFAYHCPELPARYYFVIESYYGSASNYTLYIKKRANVFEAKAANYTGSEFFHDRGNIGFTVAATCSKMVFDVELSVPVGSNSIFLNYMCREYDENCAVAGVPEQSIFKSYSSSGQYYQFYVNCTAPGTYYLSFEPGDPVTYNVRLHNGYPCPDKCWEGGVCNLESGTCSCNDGYSGESCLPGGASLRSVQAVSEVVLKADGTTYNLTKAQLSQRNVLIAIDFNYSDTQTIRIRYRVPPSQQAFTYIYYNLGAYATNSNYTAYTYLYGNKGIYKEVQLCASTQDRWYIFPFGYYFVDTLITVDMVTIPDIQDTFSGSVQGEDKASVIPVVYKFQASSSRVLIQANETYPEIIGLYIFYTCTVLQELASSYSSGIFTSDSGYGYGNYQVYLGSAQSAKTYYVVVAATGGSNFTGSLASDVSGRGSCASCSGSYKGFCTTGNYCICRKGYTSANCSEVDITDAVQLSAETTNVLVMPTGLSFFESITYTRTPPIPAGHSLFVSATGAVASVFVKKDFPVVSVVNAASFNTPNTYRAAACVERQETQYYFAFVPQNQTAGSLYLNLSITNPILPANGTAVEVPLTKGVTPFIFYLPEKCAAAYYIKVQVPSPVYNVYFGEGSSAQCLSVSQFYADELTTNVYTKIFPITNCTNVVDLQIYSNSAGMANVSMEPTTPCPNNCNNRGRCMLGGLCECDYPYIGADCSIFDAVCSVLPDEGLCQSNTPTSFYEEFSVTDQYCSLQLQSYEFENTLIQFAEELKAANIQISKACQDEVHQIVCDSFKYKCQSQTGGGVKLMLPCNSRDWQQRCTPSYDSYIPFLANIIYDIDSKMAYNSVFICNPNPSSPTSSSSSSSSTSVSTTSVATTGPRPTTRPTLPPSPSPSSSTTDANSSALRVVFAPVCFVLIFAILLC